MHLLCCTGPLADRRRSSGYKILAFRYPRRNGPLRQGPRRVIPMAAPLPQ
jgi:hypothetical protein